ncbi:MAG TPA: tRNA epoxyqueuosine(34) reductase QueG [Ilumatobacteraceae bacterium]|nr:tRNA epoxyqueuosine(34) reductase QueG [Ilumatobacteraceae bacterium]
MRRPEPVPTIEEVRGLLADRGITHVGVTSADVLEETRAALFERRDAGLHGGMGFTYRDPERSTDPQRAVAGARSIIVAARPYLTATDPAAPAPSSGPHARVGRYAWVDHYTPLRVALREVCRRIRRCDHRAVAFADDNSIVDRAVAHRAGLGWYGKNANLLLPGAGSWFVLGSIVTTIAYDPTPGPAADGCGTCTRCIEDCPTGAIVAPGVIDANRCLSWVLQKPGSIPLEYRTAIGDRIYGCDDCQDACPISVRLGRRNTVELAATADAWVDAVALLEGADDEIERRYGHWYIADRDVRWVRRNALVVLGNVGDPLDGRVRHVLGRYRADIDPILADHAAWALARLDERAAA